MGDWVMSDNLKDMTPKVIGETYLRKATETSPQRYRYGLYECQYCGREFEAGVQSVRIGTTKSCGCRHPCLTHGLCSHKFYGTWKQMVSRCNSPRNVNYKYYGERGITVCTEWLNLKTFLDWCDATYIEGMTLDRIDNDKGYSPENCRWVDASTQAINQRIQKNNKSGYTGVSWCKVRGMWTIRIKIKTKYECLGHFEDLMEAVIFRDKYIIENKLPHKLNLKQEKINE